MRQASLATLKKSIWKVTEQSVVGRHLKDISIKPGYFDEGDEFLRVIIEFDSLDGLKESDGANLIRTIEHIVSKVDQRYPSVRFTDAA